MPCTCIYKLTDVTEKSTFKLRCSSNWDTEKQSAEFLKEARITICFIMCLQIIHESVHMCSVAAGITKLSIWWSDVLYTSRPTTCWTNHIQAGVYMYKGSRGCPSSLLPTVILLYLLACVLYKGFCIKVQWRSVWMYHILICCQS